MNDTRASGHTSVLLQETIDGLNIQPGDIIVDGTVGSGGHSEAILARYGSSVRLIGLDMDADALDRSATRLASYTDNITLVQANFRTITKVLSDVHIEKVNKILLDIGLSSNQLEQSGRGFTFNNDEPLTMTFKKDPTEEDVTAYVIVNEWSEESIADIIYGYGEERYSRRIAAEIVEAREDQPIRTTKELTDIILRATPRAYHRGRIHPATRTFQALRIAVNDELQALGEGIRAGFAALAPQGRIAVISFHSLEDRIVKRYFREKADEGTAELLTKKPIVPSAEEVVANPRSRSAKLRVVVKL